MLVESVKQTLTWDPAKTQEAICPPWKLRLMGPEKSMPVSNNSKLTGC